MSHVDLTAEQLQMLAKAAEAGGRLSIRGIPDAEMTHAVFVALALHHMGLVTEPVIHKSRQRDADVIDQILVVLTEEGRKYAPEW